MLPIAPSRRGGDRSGRGATAAGAVRGLNGRRKGSALEPSPCRPACFFDVARAALALPVNQRISGISIRRLEYSLLNVSIASLPRRTIRSLVSRRPCQNRSSPCSIRGGVHAIAGRSGRSSPSSSPTLRRPWHILKRVPAPAATPNLMGGDLVDEQSTSKRS